MKVDVIICWYVGRVIGAGVRIGIVEEVYSDVYDKFDKGIEL